MKTESVKSNTKLITAIVVTLLFLATTTHLSYSNDNGSFFPLLFFPTILWGAFFGSMVGLIGGAAFSTYSFLFIYFVLQNRDTIHFIFVAVVMFLAVGYIVGKLSDLYRKTKTQEDNINKALKDKELLLREIHHRVKNNLSIIAGLLLLQAETTDNSKTKSALQEAYSRVDSMSQIYDALYNSGDYQHIEMPNYINGLLKNVTATYQHDNIDFISDVDDVRLGSDTVVSIGIIINELITNAVKYAFPEGQEGTVTLSLKTIKDQAPAGKPMVKLTISDNGIGLPKGFSMENSEGFGMTVIRSLVEQLNGDLLLSERENGTTFEILFPANLNI